jgi:hypothetical protein
LVVAGAVAGVDFFFLLCLWDLAAGAGVLLVAGSAAVGAVDLGAPAAIEAAANPMVNNAVVIRVADLFMRSPNGW